MFFVSSLASQFVVCMNQSILCTSLACAIKWIFELAFAPLHSLDLEDSDKINRA